MSAAVTPGHAPRGIPRWLGAALIAGAIIPAGRAAAQEQQAASLHWLTGCWRGTVGGSQFYEEAWLPPRAGTLFGVSRTTHGERVTGHEFLTISSDGGALVYLAQPSGQQPARFTATEVSDSLVIFANPAHDFPQRIIYQRRGQDSLLARVEGASGAGMRGIDFPLARYDCAGRKRRP